MSSQNNSRLSKAERQSQAREKARALRDAQIKKEKRKKQTIVWSVVAAVVVLAVVVTLIIVSSVSGKVPAAGPVPANANQFGGVVLDAKGVVKHPSPGQVDLASIKAAVPATGDPNSPQDLHLDGVEQNAPGSGKPVQVIVYADLMCPFCQQFEQQNGDTLTKARTAGDITVENRMIGFLDRFSVGSNYSSRAAAMLACVADKAPEAYPALFSRLYATDMTPKENTKGPSNDKLIALAKEAGADNIADCVNQKTYRPYVAYGTELAQRSNVNATPSVIVNGKLWNAQTDPSFSDFLNNAVKEVKGSAAKK